MHRLLLPLLLALAACGPHHQMQTPTDFVRFEKRSDLAMITADGVRLKSREVRNYPKADLAFWTDALKRHLIARGYAVQRQHAFRTAAGQDANTLEFLLPHGAEDWVLSETILVCGDSVVLVEAAGPFERFARVQKAVDDALPSLVRAP